MNGLESARFNFRDPKTAEIWLGYARERFDEANGRISEFRASGRQLVGWIGVVLSLEANLFPKMSERVHNLNAAWRYFAVVCVAFPIVAQLVLVWLAANVGFHTEGLASPGHPLEVYDTLRNREATDTRDVIGRYYANSFQEYNERAEELSSEVNRITLLFVYTLWVFAVVTSLLYWFTRV